MQQTMTEKAKVLADFCKFLGSKVTPFSNTTLHEHAREFLESNNIEEFVSPPCEHKGVPVGADTFVCPQRPPMASVFNYPQDDWWRGDNTCSFCGSIHPEQFMTLVKAGCALIPTDKNYKVYVRAHMEPMRKFYFDHLTIDQRKEFVELLNAKKLVLSDPGRFYVLPFFMQVVEPAA